MTWCELYVPTMSTATSKYRQPWLIYFLDKTMPNYARWAFASWLRISTPPPQSRVVLQAGAFCIRCTEKSFSRSAIDLTLEQTVNRDAESPMRGIVGLITLLLAQCNKKMVHHIYDAASKHEKFGKNSRISSYFSNLNSKQVSYPPSGSRNCSLVLGIAKNLIGNQMVF